MRVSDFEQRKVRVSKPEYSLVTHRPLLLSFIFYNLPLPYPFVCPQLSRWPPKPELLAPSIGCSTSRRPSYCHASFMSFRLVRPFTKLSICSQTTSHFLVKPMGCTSGCVRPFGSADGTPVHSSDLPPTQPLRLLQPLQSTLPQNGTILSTFGRRNLSPSRPRSCPSRPRSMKLTKQSSPMPSVVSISPGPCR